MLHHNLEAKNKKQKNSELAHTKRTPSHNEDKKAKEVNEERGESV